MILGIVLFSLLQGLNCFANFDHVINVETDFGARGDDNYDDTEKIRKASEYARDLLLKNRNAKVTVVFPYGNYLISPLKQIKDKNGAPAFEAKPLPFYSGISYVGISGDTVGKKPKLVVLPSPCLRYRTSDEAIFKKCHQTNKWARAINGLALSERPLVVENLIVYGNRNAQGPHEAYELEQKSLLFLRGTPSHPLKVEINNSEFHESPGDGVQIYAYVDIKVRDMKANFNFRGGMTITGAEVKADVDQYMSWGDARPFMSFQVEIDPNAEKNVSGKNLLTTQLRLTNARVNGVLDLGFAGDDSTFYGENIIMYGGRFLYNGLNAKSYLLKTTGHIKNSILRTSSGNAQGNTYDYGHIHAPGDLTFENVKFYAEGKKGLETTGMHIRFYNSYAYYDNQQVKFKNCEFKIFGEEPDKSSVIKLDPTRVGSNNKVLMEKAIVHSKFQYIFLAPLGGIVEANDIYSKASELFYVGSLKDYALQLSIKNLSQKPSGPLGYVNAMANNTDVVMVSSRNLKKDEPLKMGPTLNAKKIYYAEGALKTIKLSK